METPSSASSPGNGTNPPGGQSAITKWSLLGDCSNSTAIAVGSCAQLAFHAHGLHAYGGYLDGFLPASFGCSAIATEDKILTFLALNDIRPELTRRGTQCELRRGDTVVKFDGGAESDLSARLPPLPHPPANALPFTLEHTHLVVSALMDCVPKTGWGALNVEMLGLVMEEGGVVSTDNTSMAWFATPTTLRDGTRIILPRPFCTALARWIKALGEQFTLSTDGEKAYAVWSSGEVLAGHLPERLAADKPMDFTHIQTPAQTATYTEFPAAFAELLDEAAIFSDDIVLESKGANLALSTPGPISWHRAVTWAGDLTPKPLVVPLKRLRTALEYTKTLAIAKNGSMLHLAHPESQLYVVIATK